MNGLHLKEKEVEPDLITFAKGVNSSYAPLGGVIISKEISDYYDENPFTAGLTYNAHPVGIAAAIGCINEYKRLGVREHVLELEPYLKQKLAELKEKHISVGDVRSIGLFGAIEFSYSKETRDYIEETLDGKPFLNRLSCKPKRAWNSYLWWWFTYPCSTSAYYHKGRTG